MSHIKLHRNPKTNVKAKTNPNRNLQKTLKKTWKNVAKIIVHAGIRTRTDIKAANPGVNFLSFNIHRKAENAIKN